MPRKIETGLAATALIVLCVGTLTMPAEECPGDAAMARVESVSLLKTGRLAVPAEQAKYFGDRGQFFYENEKTGSWHSKFGVVNTLIYVPVLALERAVTGKLEQTSPSRVLFLNLHNLMLSIICAGLFYRIARRFSRSQTASALYALAVVYTTFCWNHFRIQNFEIHQTLFLAAAFLFAVKAASALESAGDPEAATLDRRSMLWCAVSLDALILSKSFYVLVLPLFAVALASSLRSCRGPLRRSWTKSVVLWFVVPLALGVLLLLLANHLRFGSAFNNGYTQWVREREQFSGRFLHGLWGFLFSTQFGVFTCFPILLLSLFFWRSFLERFRTAFWLSLSLALVMVVGCSFYIRWNGAWSYGPRYLLPVLPLCALPFVLGIDELLARPLTVGKSVASAAVVALLGVSLYLQVMVNSLSFYTFWTLREGIFAKVNSWEANGYLDGQPFGLLNADLLAFKKGERLPMIEALRPQLRPGDYERLQAGLRQRLVSNYYWFK